MIPYNALHTAKTNIKAACQPTCYHIETLFFTLVISLLMIHFLHYNYCNIYTHTILGNEFYKTDINS